MPRVLRGDVRWADLGPTRGHERRGRRPVVILSAEVFNRRSGTAIAMALTSRPQRAGFPLTLELDDPKLPKRSWVKIGQVRTLSTERLGRLVARLEPEVVERLVDGLEEILGR